MDLREQLRNLISAAASAVAGDVTLPSVGIDVPKVKGHGDYSTNVAMLMAKPLGRRPSDVAHDLADRIPIGGLVTKVEIKGPGFLNFFIDNASVAAGLRRILDEGDAYGRSDRCAGKTAIVEYVSANPTGPLHIGHARNAAVGECICRALERVGYRVHREYYFNDAGVQMKRLGESVRARYLGLFGHQDFPEDGYHGDYIREIAEELRAEHGHDWTDKGFLDFGSYAEARIVRLIDADMEALGIRFDEKFSEASLHASGAVDQVVARLEHHGQAYVSEGALWLRTTGEGDEKDRVLVKGDGEKTYLAPDIAYHDYKFNRGFDLIVDLLGADHHSYAIRLKAGARALGHDPGRLHVVIYQLVTVRRGDDVMRFSKRAGDTVTLREMIEEIGPDAIKFFFAMRKADSHMEFDWDLAKRQSPDNPVFYVQYAHARCCSIDAKAREAGLVFDPAAPDGYDPALLTAEAEQDLMRTLYDYPRYVKAAGEHMDPQRYTTILRSVAEQWNAYQTAGKQDKALRIVRPEAPALSLARLALVRATRQVLRNGLDALGCTAPERMDRETAEEAPEESSEP